MQWVLDTLSAYSGALGAGALLGTHLSGSQPCFCHCDNSGPNRALLDVIQGQLDRCTAAGLSPAPPRADAETGGVSAAWCWAALGLVLGLIVGTLFGVYVTLATLKRVDPERSVKAAFKIREPTGVPVGTTGGELAVAQPRPEVVTPSTARHHG